MTDEDLLLITNKLSKKMVDHTLQCFKNEFMSKPDLKFTDFDKVIKNALVNSTLNILFWLYDVTDQKYKSHEFYRADQTLNFDDVIEHYNYLFQKCLIFQKRERANLLQKEKETIN